MGKYLDQWMQTELPRLAQLMEPQPSTRVSGIIDRSRTAPAMPPAEGGGVPEVPTSWLSKPVARGRAISQPDGATTFPMPDRSRVNMVETDDRGMPLTFFPGDRPVSRLRSRQPEYMYPSTPETGYGMHAPDDTPPVSGTFGTPVNEASTFSPQAQRSRPKKQTIKNPDDVNSFSDLAGHDPDAIKRGTDVLVKQLGGEQGLNAAYQQATGNAPHPGMSREEKGQLLMEFGLRVLAHNNGQNTGLEAVGQAGAETLGIARKMKSDKLKEQQEIEQQALRKRLTEAQIKSAEKDKYELKTDKDGRMVRVNLTDGTSQVVLDEKGQPLMGNSSDSKEFAAEVDRNAYEAAFCEGLTGEAAKQCKQRALAFSKGGAPELAFPEYQRTQMAQRLMTMLEQPDNKRAKYRLADGSQKAWGDMDGDEKLQAASLLTDRWVEIAQGKLGKNVSAAPSKANNWGLTPEQQGQITEGKRAKLSNGAIVTRRNGQLVQIDEKGNPL